MYTHADYIYNLPVDLQACHRGDALGRGAGAGAGADAEEQRCVAARGAASPKIWKKYGVNYPVVNQHSYRISLFSDEITRTNPYS